MYNQARNEIHECICYNNDIKCIVLTKDYCSLLILDVQQNTLNATLAILSKTATCLRMGYIDIYVCEINKFS